MGPITPLYSALIKNFPLPPARWTELQETSVKVYFNILMKKKVAVLQGVYDLSKGLQLVYGQARLPVS